MDDRRLIRYLHGELDAAAVRALEAELARDAVLRARLVRLRGVWETLQPVAPAPVPFGYAQRLRREIEARRGELGGGILGWDVAPSWARALAGAALIAGVALGLGLGRVPVRDAVDVPAAPPRIAAATPPSPPAPAAVASPVGNASHASTSEEAAPPTVAATGVEAAPLTGEATFAEEYWQALAGGFDDETDRRDGAG